MEGEVCRMEKEEEEEEETKRAQQHIHIDVALGNRTSKSSETR